MSPERTHYRDYFTFRENVLYGALIVALALGSLHYANKDDGPGDGPIPEGPIVYGAPALVLDRDKRPDPRYPEDSGKKLPALLLKQCVVADQSKDPDKVTYDPKPKKDDTKGCEERWTIVDNRTYKDTKISGRGKILVLSPKK